MSELKFEKLKGNNIPKKKLDSDQYELDFDKNAPEPPISPEIIKEDKNINSEERDVDDSYYLYHPNPTIVAELEERVRLKKEREKKFKNRLNKL